MNTTIKYIDKGDYFIINYRGDIYVDEIKNNIIQFFEEVVQNKKIVRVLSDYSNSIAMFGIEGIIDIFSLINTYADRFDKIYLADVMRQTPESIVLTTVFSDMVELDSNIIHSFFTTYDSGEKWILWANEHNKGIQ